MSVIRSGNSSYGFCYIEQTGAYFMVYIGSSKRGPYSNFEDALNEYRRWCAS